MMPSDAILEKIIRQRHTQEMRGLDLVAGAHELLSDLAERERQVVAERFGLGAYERSETVTLEEIGSRLKVTRERVRQVIKGSLVKLRQLQAKHHEVVRFAHLAEELLRCYGGALEEQFFIETILDITGVGATERRRTIAYVTFLLNEVIVEAVERHPASSTRRAIYALPGADDRALNTVVEALVAVVDAAGAPLPIRDLLDRFRETTLYRAEHAALLDEPVQLGRQFFHVEESAAPSSNHREEERVLEAYLAAAAALDRNVFHRWGRRDWPTIHPRRMNDKIYLVLQHEGGPLHFTAISDRINAAGFDKKVAKPPSVHNELILDRRFVLVGRGTYALQEWGYKRGTVAEVVAELLRASPHGLAREQIVAEVLKRRLVKQQTVHLALMNRAHFKKLGNGRYQLANVPGA
jgi:hypothetical protein